MIIEDILPKAFFRMPIDLSLKSNLSFQGWLPCEAEKELMDEEAYKRKVSEYEEGKAKVLFTNIEFHRESCGCGDGYGCSHPDYVYGIRVKDGDKEYEFELYDENICITTSQWGGKEYSIPLCASVGDFHRACTVLGIHLEWSEYGKSLLEAELNKEEASQDMHEALKDLLQWEKAVIGSLTPHLPFGEIFNKAEAALRKAEGK